MSAFGQNGPVFLRTYGKQKRKVEQWFSPDVRKKAFSFSTTPSSDPSIAEFDRPTERRSKVKKASAESRTLRLAKQRALNALKELDSDEENSFVPAPSARRKTCARPVRKAAAAKKALDVSGLSTGGEERAGRRATKARKLVLSSSSNGNNSSGTQKRTEPRSSTAAPSLGRFVTQRKRAQNTQPEKRTHNPLFGVPSPAWVAPSRSDRLTRRETRKQNVEAPPSVSSLSSLDGSSGGVLNGGEEWAESCKHPLLCSTPSVGERRSPSRHEPSVIEISSFSCDESRNGGDARASVRASVRAPSTWRSSLAREASIRNHETERSEPGGNAQKDDEDARMHLDSQTETPKERCPSVSGVVSQEEPDIINTTSERAADKHREPQNPSWSNSELVERSTPSSPSGRTYQTALEASTDAASDSRFKPLYLSSSSFPSPLPAPPRALIDRLKIECLSSCLAVRLRPLSPSVLREDESAREPDEVPVKPPALQAAPKERTGPGTSRRACVSGPSASRWSRRGAGQRDGRADESTSLNYLLPAGVDTDAGASVCGWLQDSRVLGLPVTPLRAEQLNLSSILANFSPDALTTHSWGRLKAALSVHKKKTAIPTPRRLALSDLASPGAMDASLELFDASVPVAASRRPSTTFHDGDLSDGEKVYHECQQDGPLSFQDCIPPERLRKIGEGTFGEVFSTLDASGRTVALKIIPVEGRHMVNGEAQKSFGEILHEIIISKELSMLDCKEDNQTDGFIGLNDLHCVRGRYPDALLSAWDRFHQEKESENDRPDFFSEEQLFVILEFEFGGSDLENMSGKLSSLAQAKSILHQVTAALAVAEQALCFEHRDLHWGNVLVRTTKEKRNRFVLSGAERWVETRGVHVNIIDYSLSRLEIDGLTVSCDISNDQELFMGQGDYQFEIYRLMKKENGNCWADYNPHSNVLWLHYLADKLLSMKYKSKPQTGQQRAMKSSLKSFQLDLLQYGSATDALTHCTLFK
ncbi:uncharacterized protein haspin [Trichomycterus rosablanca]|uniref:uncharacterized protein haspin n=1 Tax=Trichomycterus rosablanca TaxID=2290929 RepID=UPI002F3570B1